MVGPQPETVGGTRGGGLLTPAGLAAAPTNNTYAPRPVIPELPVYIAKALKTNPKAWEFSQALAQLAELRRLDSYGQTPGNARAAHPRVDRTAGGGEEAWLEVTEMPHLLLRVRH